MEMKNLPKVTVCGCGSGGMAMAADLSMLGCQVNLYEHPEFKGNLDPIRESKGISLTGKGCSGKTGLAKLNRITDNAEEAIEGMELILINVPAMAVEVFVEALSPHLVEGQTVAVTTGYWASLRSAKWLKKNRVLQKTTFVEENVMPYLSRKIGPAQVHIYNFKRDLRISAWPAKKNSAAYETLRRIYPQMKLSKHVLENNFFPGNPSVHAQINIPKAEFFFERAKEFRFYGEVSLCASKLVEAFDIERIRVAKAFDCDVPMAFEYFKKTYEYKGKNIYEMFGDVTCEHVKRWSTDAGNRRVLQEDLCYFLVPMEELAEVVGVEVPVTKAILQILQIFADFDYRANGVTLKDLGLQGLKKHQIIRYLTNGPIK
jgi:opine dehydrogenase